MPFPPKSTSATLKSGAKEPKPVSASTGTKRPAEDMEPLAGNKKVKVDDVKTPAPQVVDLTQDDSEDEENENLEIPEDVQDRLDNLALLLEGLTKSYLKDVMNELPGFWGSRSGTNRQIAADIADHLAQCAMNGQDLEEEGRLIKSVYRGCYGGCGEEEEEEEEDSS